MTASFHKNTQIGLSPGELHNVRYLMHDQVFTDNSLQPPFPDSTSDDTNLSLSRHISGHLNSAMGGNLYLGISEQGIILGINWNEQELDHLFYSLLQLRMMFTPKIPAHFLALKFIKVYPQYNQPMIHVLPLYSPRLATIRQDEPHLIPSANRTCWCNRLCDTSFPRTHFVAHIQISPWNVFDPRNNYLFSLPLKLSPPWSNEEGIQHKYINGLLTELTDSVLTREQLLDFARFHTDARRTVRPELLDL